MVNGRAPLADIVRGCALPVSLVRTSLLVLIQQNCVGALRHTEEESLRGARPPYYVYEAIADNILQNIRCCALLAQAKACHECIGSVGHTKCT